MARCQNRRIRLRDVADEPDVRIIVPGVPRQTDRARHRLVTPKGKPHFVSAYTTTNTRSEMAVVRDFASQAMAGRPPLTGPIDLRLAAYFPVPASWSGKKQRDALAGKIRPTKKPDWDNIGKLVSDCLNGIVMVDDAQITDATVWKRYSDQPRVVLELRQCQLPI